MSEGQNLPENRTQKYRFKLQGGRFGRTLEKKIPHSKGNFNKGRDCLGRW